MVRAEENNINSIDISNFIYYFGIKHEMYAGNKQHDSQEFCRILLQDLNEELNEIKNRPSYTEKQYSNINSKLISEKEFFEFYLKKEKSIITDLFYCEIMTKFTCISSNVNYNFQNVLGIPLLIPVNINKIDLKQLFKIYCRSEIVNFTNLCEKCQKKVFIKRKLL